jgi:hypothetical protein
MPASLYILLEAPNIVMLTLYRNMEVQQKVFAVRYVCESGWVQAHALPTTVFLNRNIAKHIAKYMALMRMLRSAQHDPLVPIFFERQKAQHIFDAMASFGGNGSGVL